MAISLPGSKLHSLIALMIRSKASSLFSKLGAKPPSSPTDVARPFFLRIDFKV